MLRGKSNKKVSTGSAQKGLCTRWRVKESFLDKAWVSSGRWAEGQSSPDNEKSRGAGGTSEVRRWNLQFKLITTSLQLRDDLVYFSDYKQDSKEGPES